MKKLFCGALVAVLFAACAGNPPANDNGSVREKAENAYSEGQNSAPVAPQTSSEAPSAPLSTVAFKNAPTVLVTPALSGRMAASIDVVRNNPFAKTAMETINSYLTSRGYSVVGLESQAQLDEVIQLQSDIAGNDEDLSYVAGLSVGADISITYAGSIQENDIVVDLNASEASTANLLASESVRQKKEGGQSQRVLVQRAMESAIVNLENKIRDRMASQLEMGVQYKVVVRLTGDFTDDQAEEISNIVSLQIRKKFNKMQIVSMSRNTYDLLVYVDPDKYEDAQMVYGEFVEALSGLAKVRKQNITKKLIILEIK
ncbi:DUF6175 family protein [Fibrobacter sp.]|uniref:DUF6175 family protein n=1 Tax=Fibrobacter sp. TaxID=35828 RepID=UPI0025C13647|nr:DUF6175 family protein [Fibrobacter sp.]MBR3072821.1 hypothetical protein [Fibrobacter sp.]